MDLQRHADFDGELVFVAGVFKVFVLLEELFHLAMIFFQEIDRGHLLHRRLLGLFLAAAAGRGASLRAIVNSLVTKRERERARSGKSRSGGGPDLPLGCF